MIARLNISEKSLVYLYNKGLSNLELSKRFNCSPDLIRKRLKELNIYEHRKNISSSFDKQKAIIKSIKRKGFSDKYISNFLQNGFKKPYKYKMLSSIKIDAEDLNNISNYEKSIIVGCFLGDGNISKNNMFNFSHSMAQKEYCIWKTNELSNLNRKLTQSKRDYLNPLIKSTYEIRCTTNSTNDFINTIRIENYNPKKIITENLLKYYNEVSLAVHFMDDGSKTRNTFIISTESFDKYSLDLLQKHLKNKFDLNFNITGANKLYLQSKDCLKLKNILLPYIHNTMLYKLGFV